MQNRGKKESKQNKNIRTLTASNRHYLSTYSHVTHVPFIRLYGKWSKQAGFETGEKVNIIVTKKMVVITNERKKY